jgi:hypothetical protein
MEIAVLVSVLAVVGWTPIPDEVSSTLLESEEYVVTVKLS